METGEAVKSNSFACAAKKGPVISETRGTDTCLGYFAHRPKFTAHHNHQTNAF